MSKYVIKNCPNYIPHFSYFDACKCEKSGRINGNYIENCKDISDCLLKQIVERASKFRSAYADEILDLLEIEECV